jgi:hypothetical protein
MVTQEGGVTYLKLLVGDVIVGIMQMLSKLEVLVETALMLGKFGVENVLELLHDRYKLLGMFMLVRISKSIVDGALSEFLQGRS